jgi:branched-chain amino acid transport system substrate-binding protein
MNEKTPPIRLVPIDVGRRRSLALATAAVAFPSLALAQSGPIKIGYVTALSGVRAPFGVADEWHFARIRALLKNGFESGGKRYPIEIVLKDNQSDPNRSQQVASDLVLRDKVDLMLIQDGDASAPAGQLCDVHGIPMISTMTPWQSFIFGRQGKPDVGFPFSFHFMWGAEDIATNYIAMWNAIKTNKIVGTMYVDNPPGQAFADPKRGMPPAMAAAGYKNVNAGFFKIATDDFSNQVELFKSNNAQITSGFMFENHIATFWKQAQQGGYHPEAVTVAAAFLFPSFLKALGAAGNGMSSEVWWTPDFPFKSSLTGQSAKAFAADWEKSTGNQWTQPLGYAHALFEVGLGALRTASDPRDHKSVREAIRSMELDTIVGPVHFKNSPIKSVAKTSLVSGQWRKAPAGSRFPFELKVVANPTAKIIPTNAEMMLLSQLK